MGNKWSTTAITGYGSNDPPDDGTAVVANKVTYNSIKTNLTNPINSSLTVVISQLDDLFSNGSAAKTGTYTTTTSDHTRVLECTSSFTLTLLAVATAGAGYSVTVKNAGTGLITVDGDGAETIDGAASYLLGPKESATFVVNAAADGYAVQKGSRFESTFFFAVSNGTTSITNSGAFVRIALGSEVYDPGSNFTTGTPAAGGFYTVPETGLYLMNGAAQLLVTPVVASSISLGIATADSGGTVLSTTTVANAVTHDYAGAANYQINGAYLLSLTAGQRVYLSLAQNSSNTGTAASGLCWLYGQRVS